MPGSKKPNKQTRTGETSKNRDPSATEAVHSIPDTGRNRLAWITDEVSDRSRGITPIVSKNDAEILWVTTSMLDTALGRARAVLALIDAELHVHSFPILRALWEGWSEFRYLLRHGDPRENALKVLISAAIELSETVTHHLSGSESEAIADRSIDTWRTKHPEIVALIEQQRRRRKFHWSGLTLSGIERALGIDSTTYKGLSWETHAVLNPIRDFAFSREGTTISIRFERQEDAYSTPDHIGWSAGGVLFYMWNEYAERWGASPIVVPPGLFE